MVEAEPLLEQVVYSGLAENFMTRKPWIRKLWDFVKANIGPATGLIALVSLLIVGLHLFIAPDLTSLRESVASIQKDVSRIDSSLNVTNTKIDSVAKDANTRIDAVIGKFLDKALDATKAQGKGAGGAQDDAAVRERLNKVKAVLAVAADSDVRLGNERVVAVAAALKNVSAERPGLSSVAWNTMAALLHYKSMNENPPEERWLGPVKQPQPDGWPGLYGITEMKDVQRFASANTVELGHATLLITIRFEGRVIKHLLDQGFQQWPEYEMIVGGDASTVVLDKLHARNVVFKHMRVVYGGGETVLENVSFVDCAFALLRNPRTVELTDILLNHQPVSFGL